MPASVVEPTCGVGNFLLAAFERFPGLRTAIGVEIKSDYVDILNGELSRCDYAAKVKVIQESFFNVDWTAVFRDLPEPILVIGNPPWVTNSVLGVLGSTNLPKKSNFQNHGGLEALTGKSNFDISEWMLMKLLEMLSGRKATLAMLCKTAVARKALVHAWKNDISLSDAEIHPIDAAAHFDAAVDACLLTCTCRHRAISETAGFTVVSGTAIRQRLSAITTASWWPMCWLSTGGSILRAKKSTNGVPA